MINPVRTILYYLFAAIAIFFAIRLFPSGSCGPNVGVLIFLSITIMSIVIFLNSLVKTFKGNKETKISTLIHFLGCSALIIYFFTADQL
jgi:hypothetical protein